MSDQNKKDPWSGRNQESPPDLLELVSKLFKKTKPSSGASPELPSTGDAKSLSIIALFIILGVAVLWFLSGFYIVAPTEQAPVLRFGKYIQTDNSGLHWIPRFIESAYPVNTSTINKITLTADMLTQDENIVSVEVAVQYRINNASDYLFNVVNPVGTLNQVTSSAMRQVIGDTKLDDILTTGREKVRDSIAKGIDSTLSLYNTGLEITDVNLQPAKPPSAVTAAFDDAINAREDKQKYINQALAYQNQVLSLVSGQQSRIMQEAQAYQSQVTQEAQGNVARYLALLKPFNQNPQVMSDKLYYETLGSIFKHTTNVINDTNGHSIISLSVNNQSHGKADITKDKNQVSDASASVVAAPVLLSSASASQTQTPDNPYDSDARPTYGSIVGGQS
jgi:membrane protease subunit HflK